METVALWLFGFGIRWFKQPARQIPCALNQADCVQRVTAAAIEDQDFVERPFNRK